MFAVLVSAFRYAQGSIRVKYISDGFEKCGSSAVSTFPFFLSFLTEEGPIPAPVVSSP